MIKILLVNRKYIINICTFSYIFLHLFLYDPQDEVNFWE